MKLPDEIQEVRVLRLQPGDTLVLKVDAILNPSQRENLAEAVKRFTPEGVKCMVLEKGFDLEVLRAD